MKKKFKISKRTSIVIGISMVIIPIVLFFSWLNFSSGGFNQSVEAKLFSSADFKNGPMLSASCEGSGAVDVCEWSSCSDEGDNCIKVCQGKDKIREEYGSAIAVADMLCRNISDWTLKWHPNDDGSIDGEHYANCEGSECSAVSNDCTINYADGGSEAIANGGKVTAYLAATGCPCYSQTRVCSDGKLHGLSSYIYKDCTENCEVTCDPDQICIGQTCPDGEQGRKQCGWQEVAP